MQGWRVLLDGIAGRLTGRPAVAGFLPLLADLPATIDPAASRGVLEKLPVQRFWPMAGAGDNLGRLMSTVDDALKAAWRQNPSYRAHPPSAGFLDNYGYLECAGPDAPLRTSSLRLGLLLLGPDTLYPQHHHPAEEVYLPLGPGRWLRDGDGWQDVPAGAVIHHPPMCGHATLSESVPLAAIYLWRGEIGPAARIV